MKLPRALLFLAFAPFSPAQPTATSPYVFTTLAGIAAVGSTDGTGPAARFNFPGDVACDAAGNLFVADTSNHTIRKITPDGVVSTFAGKAGYPVTPTTPNSGDGTGTAARLTTPRALALDAAGNLYVAGGGDIPFHKITPAGVVTLIPSGSPNGFISPEGIVVASANVLYVSDTGNNTIRKITLGAAGSVTTLAGGTAGSADGAGSAAQFNSPRGLAIDSSGTVYVADTANQTIRKITPDGVVTTFAGTAGVPGHADGMGTAAQFNYPTRVAVDLAGNVFVADYGDCTVRKITPSGAVSTFAGAVGIPGHIDGNFSDARLYQPQGIAVDATGNVFVADSRDQTIRKITPASVTSTVAGLSPLQSNGSSGGNGTDTRFRQPVALAVGPTGNVYVADLQNHLVRKTAPNGFTVTLAGKADEPGTADGVGEGARFNFPSAVALDAAENVYVVDSGNSLIRKITPGGTVTTVAGIPGARASVDGPPGTGSFGYMMGVAVLPNGNLVVSEATRLRLVAPDGTLSTLPVTSSQPYSYFGAIATDAAGNIDVLDVTFGDILTISPSGTVTRLKPNFSYGGGIAVDPAGNIFVSGREDQVVWKLSLNGVATVIGGLSGVIGSADGVGDEARFENPTGIGVDAAGNVYVTCCAYNSNTIRKGQAAGAPVITMQPQGQTVARGSNVQLSVTATGFPTPTYQWYFNNTAFDGATSSTLSLANVQSTDAGDYTVVVTNAVGTVTSSKATLTLASGPVTPPANPSPSSGGGGGAPSLWFLLALLALGLVRLRTGKRPAGWRHFLVSK